jgi:hypothetical protein
MDMGRARPPLRLAAALVGTTLAASQASGADDPREPIVGRFVRDNVSGTLAVLGISAVPSETASALILDTGSDSDNRFDFSAAQLGGGFRWSDEIGLYLEGYIGWSRYDPVLLLTDKGESSRLPFKFTSAAATGGIGWEFDLGEHLVLRPLAHLVLGRIQSDVSVAAQVVGNRLGLEPELLKDGGVTAGGYGGSLSLVYNRRWANDYEADLSLRYTQIRLEPIAGDSDLMGNADAITGALWSRLRGPTGYRAFGRPVRWVTEFSASYLPGDQGDILQTDWLMQIGGGGEIDLEETWVPWVTTTRLVARYTRGEYLEGFSVGLAASF